MIIGSISENKNLEKRISITPDIAKKYIDTGFSVNIEKDYGVHLGISDNEFLSIGCEIKSKDYILKSSDLVLQMNLPEKSDLSLINEKKILIGNFNSNNNKDIIEGIKDKISI